MHNPIKILTIENFQSHVKTEIEFAPNGQLTVITGQTDSGKTAIFRALRWLLYNTPQGSDFIRAGCTFCRVTAEMENGHIIIREMTASKNQYRIIVPDVEKPVVIEGFGRSVPVEVQNITGVKSVMIGDDEFNLNMAEQLDGPFLGKSISAPARAKVIGKLAGTEVLDYAGKQAGTDLYRRNQDEKQLSADVELLAQTIATYDYLPQLAEKITAVEMIVADVRAQRERMNRLVESQGKLAHLKISIDQCNIIIEHLKNIDVANQIVSNVTAKSEKFNTLTNHRIALEVLHSEINDAQQTIKRLQPVAAVGEYVARAETAMTKLNQLTTIRNRINLLDSGINDCNATINRMSDVEKAEESVNKILAIQDKLVQLIDIRSRLDTVDFSIESAEKFISESETVTQAETIVNEISVKFERLSLLRDTSKTIQGIQVSIEDLKGSVILHENRVKELEGTYQDELISLGVCPTCGTVLNKLPLAS